MLIARFDGDVEELTAAYDRAHDLIMSRGGAVPAGELRHHCATSDDALYIIGVWDSDESVRARWASTEFKDLLASVGSPDSDRDDDPRTSRDRTPAELERCDGPCVSGRVRAQAPR